MSVLRSAPATIRALLVDAEGEPLDKGTKVEVTVTADSSGEPIVEGDETKVEGEDGIAVYELEALEDLDLLTVSWKTETATFTTVEEMVGLRLCSLAQVEEDVTTESLTAEGKRVAREIAERFLEDACGVAWRPSYAREVLDGNGRAKLIPAHPRITDVRSVTMEEGGTKQTVEPAELKINRQKGYIWREGGWPAGEQNINLIYEHGFTDPPPMARRAAALLARHIAMRRLTNLEDRATTYTTDEATYSLIVPGIRGNLTALPEVNSFIELNNWKTPMVG